MKCKSFGCSFVFGTDLADDGRDLPVPTASNYTWPAHLARHLGYHYECYARPGSGNLQIAERVLSHAVDNDSIFFIIGWTGIDRFDYTNSTISNNPIQSQWCNWKTVMPVDQDALAKHYYKGLHSEYRDKLCSLMYIKLVIDTLQQKHIPFVMTYMDELMFDRQWNTTDAINDLQEHIEPFMIKFDNQTFLEWSRAKGFDISTTMHPLEQAHQAAADYMISVFDKQKITDPVQPARV
jgi:hypothetical protein